MAVSTAGAATAAPQTGKAVAVSGRTSRARYAWPIYAALAVLGGVVVVAVVEIIAAVLGTAPLRGVLAGYPAEVRWREPSVRLASLVVVGAGMTLSSLALLPLRRRWWALWTDDPCIVGGLSRAQIREELERRARAVPGAYGNVVVLDRRGATATTRPAPGAASAAVAEAVRVELQATLEELAPGYALRVRSRACHECGCGARVCGTPGRRILDVLRLPRRRRRAGRARRGAAAGM